jgi:3-oxoacyl-[acyl-carrier protein] reductase
MNNRIAIVTGASQGIGQATAIRLAKDFAGIVLAARNDAGLKDTVAAIEKAGAKAISMDIDLRDRNAPAQVVEKTLAAFGRLDALLNIAGAVPQIDLFDMTDDQWNDGAELKLHGARRLAIHAWDALKKSRGSVVFMSGNSAQEPKPGFAAVATINAAIVALAKAFAYKGLTDGVQVNSVLPGPVMSNRRKSFLEHWAKLNNLTTEEASKKFLEEAHIERYGEPEEIAELMAFLVSPGARWMTGAAIRMDGGEIKVV